MNLTEHAWTDATGLDTNLAVLPVGSTEQHGPHAPLGTDTLTAKAVTQAGIDRYNQEVIVGPAIPVGVAAEHRQFPGTLWVSEETFRRYVRETIESLVSHGWNRVVLVNGHGGNVDALRELCGTLVREETAYAVPFTWFDAAIYDDVEPDIHMGHGGPVETSVVQHVDSELIREERLEAAAEGAADGWGQWQSGVNLAYDSAEFSENGVVGDPREGGADVGEQLLESTATALAELLVAVRERDVTRPAKRDE
ncbi:creatininase family protein [Halovenus rubra]|uniref:Creatininase family protein n=2 Tax=Halovenus rubra TaxID=869890 RepID=A0ABD5X3H8_9EURY|nr:creatininase family protein [Halovenus rubra]